MDIFPANLYTETQCGGHQALYDTHGVYSESAKQRKYLYILSRRNGYEAPRQTCCHHQVRSLIKILRHRIIETAQDQ